MELLRAFVRRRRARKDGYRAGIVGRSHNEMPHYKTLDEPVLWVVGWQIGHVRWMFSDRRL